MNINCVTINLSEKQLNLLRLFSEEQNDVKFISTFDDYLEFVKSNRFSSSDLIFLNIDDSNQDIFLQLQRFSFNKGIVFICQNKSFAYEALKIGAVDFLLNPINKSEFKNAIDKAKKIIKSKKIKKHSKGDFIYVKSNLKNIKLYVNSIKWIQALGDYIKIICEDNTYVVLSTMKVFERKLSDFSFLRIHKSYIINLKKIDQFTTKYVVIKGDKIPLSRTKKPHLYELLKIK